MKVRLVRYLHEKLGYNVLALEAGMIETGLAGLKRSKLSDAQFMDAVMFSGMRGQEMKSLFAYLKSKPKLRLIGLDPQFSSDEVLTLVPEVIPTQTLAKTMANRLGEPYQYRGLTDPSEFKRRRDDYLQWLGEALDQTGSLKSTPGLEIVKQGLKGLRAYWNYEHEVQPLDLFAKRDQAMFDHFNSQVKAEKTILWAHNGHIGKGLGYRILGDHLIDKFQSKTFSIGLFARKGEYKQHWSGQVSPWNATTDGLESRFPDAGQAWFSSAKEPSLQTQSNAFEPENGGVISFRPSERFNAVILVNQVTPPTK